MLSGWLKKMALRATEIVLAVGFVIVFFALFMVLLGFSFPQGTNLRELMFQPDDSRDKQYRSGIELEMKDEAEPFIATLAEARRTVKDRPANGIAWSASRNGMPLKERHAVQTLSRSQATISFGAGGTAGPRRGFSGGHPPARGSAGHAAAPRLGHRAGRRGSRPAEPRRRRRVGDRDGRRDGALRHGRRGGGFQGQGQRGPIHDLCGLRGCHRGFLGGQDSPARGQSNRHRGAGSDAGGSAGATRSSRAALADGQRIPDLFGFTA